MSLFSGLEKLGLNTDDIEIYEKKKDKSPENKQEEQREKQIIYKEEDYLFLKSYKCPICDKSFKSLTVRSGKIRVVDKEDDLRPVYRELDPIKYEPVVCYYCGYASLSRYFDTIMPLQAKRLRAEVKSSFLGLKEAEKDFYSYDDAIMRYKMVLYCDVIGNVKSSRKAYTCLKMAWVIRGKLENEGDSLTKEERNKLQADELECIQNAYEGYCLAFSSETFPVSGMDEMTLTYLVAELAFRLGNYREALQLLSRIIGNGNVSTRIKSKAVDLKERIRAKVKEGK
ncbi:MAG: DUF2225 domain-containing protein [Clostridiales bacterium]|nr:DUF2225 domain-containing protein [Clostridiales bacterium]